MVSWRAKTVQVPKTIFWFLVTIVVTMCLLLLLDREGATELQNQEDVLKPRIQLVDISTVLGQSLQSSREVVVPTVDLQDELTKEDVSGGKLNISQDDPRLLKYILKQHLTPPPKNGSVDTTAFDPRVRKHEQQMVYRFILNLLDRKEGGVYIECGANDGEYYSNTLPLELKQNWTGLLVEADPRPFKRLLGRKRKAWLANTCLSTTPTPQKIEMMRNDKGEGLSFIPGLRQIIGNEKDYYSFEAQCFPLYSILRAINLTTIDYFSLDIEGAELGVLKSIPWDSVLIKTLSIEVHPEYVKPIRDFMTSIGYIYVKFIQNGYSHDQIYMHSSLQKNKKQDETI